MDKAVTLTDLAGGVVQGGQSGGEIVIDTDNTFTTGALMRGLINLIIENIGTSVVTLQRSFDDGDNWHDVYPDGVFTSNGNFILVEPEDKVLWRAGVAGGNLGAGDEVYVRLSQ